MSDNLSISSLSDQKWKAAPPPPELFHSPPGTSDDIESILESSIEQLQDLHKLEDRLERQQQLAEERDRLGRQRLAAEENSFQQQQELHLLSILKERSEREFTATGNNLQQQQQRAAEERNVSASKGKEKITQEPQENMANVDSQPTPSRRGFGNGSGDQSSVIAPPPQTQGHISTSTPGQSTAPAASPAAAMLSPPVREALKGSRSLFRRSPPAYAESSSAAAARPPAATKGSPTSVGSPPSDIGSSSSRKWGLRLLRPYMTTVFKPRSRSSRSISSKPTSESTPKTEECVSCMEDFEIKEMVHVTCHNYCSPCFALLIETSISTETSWPPKCCLNEVPKATILDHIHGKLKTRYETMLEERSIAIEDRVYCSKPSCGSWIPHHKIDKPSKLARCGRCRHKTCMICRGPYHSDGECPDDPNLRETIRYATNAGWRRCYKCNALVEHAQGCSHMICHCKAQFCYTCGLKWKTCGCTEIELEAYLISADWRRESAAAQAQIRQAAYAVLNREVQADQTEHANELRDVLNLLENAEERTPAQERAFAVVAEREDEEDRSREFEAQLQMLREEMDLVHSIQQIANFDRFEAENRALEDAAKEEIAKIDDYFHALSLEEKDAMVGEYLILLRRAGIELSDEMMNGAGKGVDMSKAIDEQIAYALRPSNLKSPAELTREKEVTARYIEFFKRQGKEPTEHVINIARKGAAKRTVKMRQLAREARHDQQSDKINAILEEEQELLRARHQTDMKWFEEVARVRDALLVQMTVDEYSV